MSETKKLIKKVKKMDLGNPIITTLVGLVVFYIGLKMFSGGMKSMGGNRHLYPPPQSLLLLRLGQFLYQRQWQPCLELMWEQQEPYG